MVIVHVKSTWIAKDGPSPVVMWSDMSYFSGKNVQVKETVYPYDIQQFLFYVISQAKDQGNPLLNPVVSEQKPEVLVVFLEPKLSTTQLSRFSSAYTNGKGAFSNLKSNIENSITSAIAPYVSLSGYSQDDIQSIYERVILHHLQQYPSAFTVFASEKSFNFDDKVKQVTLSNLMDTLKSKADILHDGITDIIVVQFSDMDIELETKYTEDDDLLGEITGYIEGITNWGYLGFFTSSVSSVVTRYNDEDAYYHNYARSDAGLYILNNQSNTTTPNNTYNDTYFPPDVWEGLLVAALLFFLTWIGVQCTFSLQSPEKFEGGRK